MLLIISIIGLLLLVWFRTDAWLEYCRLLHLDRISFYADFDKKRYDDVSLTYHLYLRRDHNCFFVRLITCPICFSVWLGLIGCIFVGITQLPFLALGGLAIYGLIDGLLG